MRKRADTVYLYNLRFTVYNLRNWREGKEGMVNIEIINYEFNRIHAIFYRRDAIYCVSLISGIYKTLDAKYCVSTQNLNIKID